MSEALAIALGTAVGILACLVPGLHAALALTFLMGFGLVSWLGPGPATLFLAAAAGAIVYTRRLGAVYHPSAVGDDPAAMAAMDVAQRLTSQGQGPQALRLMTLGVDIAWVPVTILTGIFLLAAVVGIDLAHLATHSLGILAVPLILVWLVHTVFRSRSRVLALVGLILTGVCGFAVLHMPALQGNEHQLAPLMGGLFGIPMMLTVLDHGKTELAPQQPCNGLEVDAGMGLLGAIVGLLSSFMAGIGAGSLVGMLGSLIGDHEPTYLLTATAGEAAKETAAILLLLMAGSGHTGEAQLLGRTVGSHLTPIQVIAVLAALVIGAFFGRKAVFALETPYQTFIRLVPPGFWAGVVIVLALWQVWLTGLGLPAFLLAGACTATALFARAAKLPLQVGFAALALPMLVTACGGVPGLDHLLFSTL